jgi:hypothetical protein
MGTRERDYLLTAVEREAVFSLLEEGKYMLAALKR